jgi:uncharacterized protein involved in tolerance to divalent cations
MPHRRQAAVDFLQAHHPYEVPEIVSATVDAAESYVNWLASQVAEQ